jgi:uncharacterized protein YdeI (YjbR/CyaY-like superfamily)
MILLAVDGKEIFYSDQRSEWRQWLEENHADAAEIWFTFPTKESK